MDLRKTNLKSFNQQSLAEKAVKALADEIISGQIAPGSRLELNGFAQTWDISMTPLRDAAKQLEAAGLVQILPRKGIFVSHLTEKEVSDIFNLRLALETIAIKLATSRVPTRVAEDVLTKYVDARDTPDRKKQLKQLGKVDALIHQLAYDYCDNIALQKVMDMTNDLFEWSRNTIISDIDQSYLGSIDEHVSICKAVVAGKPDEAANQMRIHLENSLDRYLKHYRTYRANGGEVQ